MLAQKKENYCTACMIVMFVTNNNIQSHNDSTEGKKFNFPL